MRLRAIPTTGMAETDRMSHELLERQLVRANVSYELKNYEMPLNQQGGLHTSLSAYTEGWALYAEDLGKEIGLYKDPVSDYGRLNSELFRAVRLVVDTGIHDKGWTRDQVIAYMHENDVNDVLVRRPRSSFLVCSRRGKRMPLGFSQGRKSPEGLSALGVRAMERESRETARRASGEGL